MSALMELNPHPLHSSDRVLIVRLGAVGDVLRTLPAVHLIRRTFPGIHLEWIVEDLSRDMLIDHPDIDAVLPFPRAEFRAAARRPARLVALLRDLAKRLRTRRFTVAIDAQGSFKSGLITWLSGAPRRVGFAPGLCREMSFLLTNEWVRLPDPWLNRVDRNLRLAESIGAAGDEITMMLPETPEEGRSAAALLDRLAPERRPVVLLSPGTSRRQRHKKWPPTSYARLARTLRRGLDVIPVVTWGPGEETLAGEVIRGSGGTAVMAPRSDLRLLAALLRRAALFIGADTGPMHLAWGVGCPVIALFGPTDPRLNAPLGPHDLVLRNSESTTTISAAEVVTAAQRILRGGAAPRSPGEAHRLSRASLFGTGSAAVFGNPAGES